MATPKITLVQYPGLTSRTTLSPPCAKVHMALRYKGLEYSTRNLLGPHQVKRYNPRGRVPALIVDGETVVDSTDILTHIEERFPSPPLEPSASRARAESKILEDWADEVLYFYGVWLRWCLDENFRRMKAVVLSGLPIPMRWIVPLFARRTVRRRARGQGVGLKEEATVRREVSECFDVVVRLLRDHPFLTGETIARGDIAVAAVFDQLCLAQLTPGLAAEIGGLPEIVEWLDRVHALAPNAAVEATTPGPPRGC